GFSIDPNIAGQWTWVGTHAVVFEPEAHQFPLATAFHVKVPEQLSGIDGTRLAQSVGFEFTTARPELWFHDCNEHRTVAPTASLRVSLSQRTSMAEVERAVRVQIRDIGTDNWSNWPLRLSPNERYPERVYRISPKTAWPIGSEIRLSADATLRSNEGSLQAGKRVEASCRTHTAPLATVECWPSRDDSTCVTGRFAELSFSNPPVNRGLLNAIRIEPLAPFRLRDTGLVELGELKSDTTYRVTIPKGLRGKFGGRTEKSQTLGFRTSADVPSPRVSIGVNGERLEPHLLGPIRMVAADTKDYSIGVRALSAREFLALRPRQYGADVTDARALLSGHWTHHHVEEVPTKPFDGALDVKPWLDRSTGSGTLLIDIEPTAPDAIAASPRFESEATILSVSNLALTTKLWLDGGLVWVTSLSDQRPVADARVSLVHHGVSSLLGVTGADGLATIPVEALAGMWAEELVDERRGQVERGPWMLLVERDNDWSTLDLQNSREHVGDGAPEPNVRSPRVSLFLDRGVYRPGDRVYVKGYVHQMTAGRSHPLVDRTLAIELINLGDSSHQTIAKRSVRSNGFGGFATEFDLPARLERPRLELGTALGGQIFGTSIFVSETRALEFDVSVTSPQPVVANASARFQIQGTYLFGEPMRQAKVKWRYTLQPDAFTPPNASQYQTSAAILQQYEGERRPRARIPGGEARLSNSGTFDLDQRLEEPPLGPQRLTLHAEVFDVARQAVTGFGSVLVHPAAHYVGLNVKAASVHAPAAFDVVALGLDGERLSGREIEVSLFREANATEPEDSDDEQHAARLVFVARCRLRSDGQVRACPLVPRQPGTHVIVADSRDDQGAWTRAADTVYVTENAKNSRHESIDGRWPVEPSPLQTELDRTSYHTGEVAHLTVNSPFEHAWAIVTLERDGVYWHEERDIGRRAHFDVPVRDDMGNNAFVNVMALRRGGRKSAYPINDTIDVAYAHGSVPL
ncbi:MAG TPA: MG2 domain-containing protein, partial [Polyangiaceae bacterium]|nr:MG2 domain-containing protein [Polyangiaceae bacterium]